MLTSPTRKDRDLSRFFAAAVAALALAAAAPAVAQTLPRTQVAPVAGGLNQPTTLDFIGEDDVLVLQKTTGQVRRILGGVLQAGNVLDVNVHYSSERGLLGIAVHPDFARTRWVFLYYTESSVAFDTNSGLTPPLGNRVYRYTWTGAALVDPMLILDLPFSPGPNHDGGIITFGPDDRLYVVIGDLNRNGQLENFPAGAAPDDTAVILRLNDDGSIPTDNPFYDPKDPTNPLGRYYAYGVRNSFGMSHDRFSGHLWDTENGPGSYDEINLVRPGFNSGWEQIMGPDSRDAQDVGDLWHAPGSSYGDPEFSWLVPVAPTAIAFVESPRAGCEFVRDALVGDSNCGRVYLFEPTATRDGLVMPTPALADRVADGGGFCNLVETPGVIAGSGWSAITDIKNAPDGSLWIVDLFAGVVYRAIADPAQITDGDADGVDDSCDCDPGDDAIWAEPIGVDRLRPAGLTPNLAWESQDGLAGPGTTATVVSGSLNELRADGDFSAACTMAQVVGSAEANDPRADPAPGDGYYYLVRYENQCGTGTVGDSSLIADPRDTLDASVAPPACP